MSINPFDLLKNVQKLQEQAGGMRQRLEAISATGCAGGGMVEVDMNGVMEVLAVRISPEVVSPENKEMLEPLITAACADARSRVTEMIGKDMTDATGIPNLASMFSGLM